MAFYATSSSSTADFDYSDISEPEMKKFKYSFSDDSLDKEYIPMRLLKNELINEIDKGYEGDHDNSDTDTGLPNHYLHFEQCQLCKTQRKNINYPYCFTCFTWRRKLFPYRLKKRRRSCLKLNKSQADNNRKNIFMSDTEDRKTAAMFQKMNINSSESDRCLGDRCKKSIDGTHLKDIVDGPRQLSVLNVNSDLCSFCFSKLENSLFVYLRIKHKCACSECCKQYWLENCRCLQCGSFKSSSARFLI